MYTAVMRTTKVVKPNNKNAWDVEHEKNNKRATLRSYGGSRSVAEMFWDLNPACKRDQIFELRIGKEHVLLDAEELLRYLRWI